MALPYFESSATSLVDASGARSALYVGDDVTDEAIFRLRRPDLLSVRIERDVGSAADFFLHQRLDIFQLLDDLIRRLRDAQAENWCTRNRPVDSSRHQQDFAMLLQHREEL